MPQGERRVALHKTRLTTRTVADAPSEDKRYILWDDALTGFGVRVSPTGRRSFIVQYCTRDGGGESANRKKVLGHFPALPVHTARKRARALLRSATLGPRVPEHDSTEVPTLRAAFESYLGTRPTLAPQSRAKYRQRLHSHAPDWLERTLDTIGRTDVEERFRELSTGAGPAGKGGGRVAANHFVELLSAIYRTAGVDHDALSDPVALWRAAGGKRHRTRRRTIAPPAEVLPRWRKGLESVPVAVVRDMVWMGLYTGLRLSEVQGLRWEHVDESRGSFRVDTTKSGRALVLPVTGQVDAVLARRCAVAGRGKAPLRGWVFPGRSSRGYYRSPHFWYPRISERGGATFWFHACRYCFITVAIRDLMLGDHLVKRLVNHAPSRDVTARYAADWTLEQLRVSSQRIADRIDALAYAEAPCAQPSPKAPGRAVLE